MSTDAPSEITLDVSGAVATVTMSRPAALNAITPTMLAELNSAFQQIEHDPAVRVAVLTGAGRAFSAGVDLKALGDRSVVNGTVGDILDVPARALLTRLSTMPKPVVAAVNGFCFTGALEIALACDIIVVSESARLGDTHAKWGLRPTWGLSQRLHAAVGPARARELSYTARSFSGVEALAMGLAARSAPHSDFDAAVGQLVGEILANSSGSAAAYKDLYRVADRGDMPTGLAYEASTQYPIDDTDDRLADFR